MGGILRFNRGEPMSDESQHNDPPQIAYYVGFGLAILFLAITMVRYPLW